MTQINNFLDWLANFKQSEQDTRRVQRLDDIASGKELVARYLLKLIEKAKISNPEEAANCIVADLLQLMRNKGKHSTKEGLDPLDGVGRSPSFAGQILERDNRRCVITQQVDRSVPKAESDTNRVHLEAAHIFPSSLRSLGEHRGLIDSFVAYRDAAIVSGEAVHDAWNGLAMQHDVHQDFDNYLFGLKWVAPNMYEVERINMKDPGLSFALPEHPIDLSRVDKTGDPGPSLILLHYHMAKLFEALRLQDLSQTQPE
ncbi:hypothetical protein Q9L58_005649 [Maublancomyces gigas]|uniref:HNH nuclease domain-containing protein n=1 Tax=Discina gigas TaxID=1032678 RepID=A0ABR3GIQ3_9PEZI